MRVTERFGFGGDWRFLFLWFGGAISLSEILAGTLLAPMGLYAGLAAIIIGHVIGTTLLVLAGLIGTRTGLSAIGTTEMAFGRAGRRLFAVLNIVQLVGWTAVMLKIGSGQFASMTDSLGLHGGTPVWLVGLGALVCVWVIFGRAGVGALNILSVALLVVLSLGLFWQLLFAPHHAAGHSGVMRFGAGLELVVVMPLSWLPLIADYNRHGHSPIASAVFSWWGYMIASSWMYAVGLLMGLTAGQLDFTGLAGGPLTLLAVLGVIALSTVTTTFMDAYSAGVSATNVSARLPARPVAVMLTVAGVVIALLAPIGAYRHFLYMIGAVFSPLYAVVLSHYLLCQKEPCESRRIAWPAVLIWAAGVGAYYGFLALDTPLGATVPGFLATAIVYWMVHVATRGPRDGRLTRRRQRPEARRS